MIVPLPDLEAVDAFGARIAEALRAGDVLALSGPLGAGKTTLARAILDASGHVGPVPSPTFTLMQIYDGPKLRVPIVHSDFYRLVAPGEVNELGLDEYRADHALIVEWPEKGGGFANDAARLSIALEDADRGRRAIVEPGPGWVGRMR